jgi:putative membrane protein
MTNRSRTRLETLDEDLDDLTPRKVPMAQPEVLETGSSRSLGLWLIVLAFLTFIGFLMLDIYWALHQAWSLHPTVSVLLGVLSIGFFVLLLALIWREIRGYLRLGQIQTDAARWQQAWQSKDQKQLETLLNHVLKQQRHSHQAWSLVQAYQQSIQSHHTIEQKLFIYDSMVAQPLLKKAKALINKEALRASGVGLLSLNNLMETLVLFWRSARIVKGLAELYGYQPGLVGNIKLLKISLENVLIQQTADMLIEEGVNALGKGLLGSLSQQAGKAASTGVLVKRIGKATLGLLTPISALEVHVKEK